MTPWTVGSYLEGLGMFLPSAHLRESQQISPTEKVVKGHSSGPRYLATEPTREMFRNDNQGRASAMDSVLVSPQNLYTETLTPNVMALGGRAFGR